MWRKLLQVLDFSYSCYSWVSNAFNHGSWGNHSLLNHSSELLWKGKVTKTLEALCWGTWAGVFPAPGSHNEQGRKGDPSVSCLKSPVSGPWAASVFHSLSFLVSCRHLKYENENQEVTPRLCQFDFALSQLLRCGSSSIVPLA